MPIAKRELICNYCNGRDFAANVRMSQTATAGNVGFSYQTRGIFLGHESLLADVCKNCGTIVRFHVENPNQNWVTATRK